MVGTKEAARKLVRWHRKADPQLKRIFLYPHNRQIRLLEVSEGSPSTGKLYPFTFAPDEEHGISFPLVLIEVSPQEAHLIESGKLKLPRGWGSSRELLYSK